MANFYLNIFCSSSKPVPNNITPKVDDTVIFVNNTGAEVELKFSDPDKFKSKKSKITIPSPGDKTLTIGDNKKATTYKWKCPNSPELATRTGRIDPS